MSFIIVPILNTPLLKVPILLCDAVCIHYALKPPSSTKVLKMQHDFAWSDYITRGTWVQVALAAILRASLITPLVIEGASILAEHAPGSGGGLVDQVQSHILLFSGNLDLHATPTFLVGSSLTIAGGLLRIYCHRTLGRFFAWQATVQDDHELITTGPYAVVRHPSFTALALIAIGAPLAILTSGAYFTESGILDTQWGRAVAGTAFGWLWLTTCALVHRIDEEEEELKKKFGEEWRIWAARVPYRLIPFVY
ncbi:hypothetical protein C8Q79DRAFT_1009199 [Trametes meyenii]|nr:hypothetical protein C8Q79DRAFT_1009199 [Trametes meyenii]